MSERGFGVSAVLKLTGISYRNLDYWATTGLVRSSIRSAAGKGSRRVYAFSDLVALRVVRRLRDAGIPLQAIRRAVQYLRSHGDEPLTRLALIADGKRVLTLTDDPRTMIDATRDGQVVIAIDVAPIRRHLEASVTELSAPRELTVRASGHSYRVLLTPDLEAGGFAIEVPELPGCFSEAENAREAVRMSREAIELWLEASRSAADDQQPRRAARHR
jgi:DNA-binding transcriptional MerR regulator/predicted RNase H-like HicB family nuclease